MNIALIAARARNGVIGRENTLPWHLPEDLLHFKTVTMGKPMIMGRKTFESIGKPLPGRTTIVLTTSADWCHNGVVVCHSLPEAIAAAEACLQGEQAEIMVVGGEQIYRQCLPLASTLYLTEVDVKIDGDAYFPEIDEASWLKCEEASGISAKNGISYSFLKLKRR